MSGWDGYVNDMMKNTGLFDNASILSKEDYGEWATTDGFSVSKTEAAALVETVGNPPAVPPTEVIVNGVAYQIILLEKRRLYAEMKSNVNAGLLVLIGKQVMVVGTYPAFVQPGLAVDSIEKLVVYLGEQGF